jgi:peptidoglycan/LPS O-acetylase OafA/YrhL
MRRERQHRPEIDGLRAVAVLGVMLFHLDPGLLPGGFTGVDVFFVISGYLVGGILLGAEAGGLRLAEFWQRRVARIWPAFGVVLAAVLGASLMLYDDWDRAAVGSAVVAALLAWSNHHQLGLGGYFAVSEDTQPLLHCWSLAVEEQFYLVLPVGFALCRPCRPVVRMRVALALGAASFWLCLWMTGRHPSHAFYLLPMRAWELLAGVMLAMVEEMRGPVRHGRVLAGWLGLGLIGTGFVHVRGGAAFPGWQALLPVAGALGVIMGRGSGWLGRLLSTAPLQTVGRWSYSLYLWHWPVFSLTDYRMLTATDGERTAVKLLVTMVLALACHRWIELPSRAALRKPQNRRLAWGVAAVMLATGVAAGLAFRSRFYRDGPDGSGGCLVFSGSGGPERTIVLVGDSHATMYAGVVRELAAAADRRLVLVSEAGGDPLSPGILRERVAAAIVREKPGTVIMACHWAYKLSAGSEPLESLMAQLLADAGRIVLLMQPPIPPPEAERTAIRQGQRSPFTEDPADAMARLHARSLVGNCAAPRVAIIDPEPLFREADGSIRILDAKDRPVFHDRNHLTGRAARAIRPMLESQIER